MIKKIRLLLEYKTDPVWLYLEKSISDAISILLGKIGDRYELVNDIELPQLGDCAG